MTAATTQDTQTQEASGLRKYLPILQWLPQYNRAWLATDFIAGLTVTALLVPEGMAYAELAGMPPQTVFYAAPIGLLLYAIFGTSRQLVVAVSATIAVMSASIVGEFAVAGTEEFIALSAALAMLTGIVAILAGLLRLGRIANFFSESVLAGFVTGLALVIAIKQVPKLFGLEAAHGNFWARLYDIIIHLPETDWLTLFIGVSSLLLMIIIERRFHRIPAALVAMLYGIVLVSVLGLAEEGVHIVGDIPAGLAGPTLPGVSVQDLFMLLPGAVALTLVAFAESIGPARSFADKHRYTVDADQELIGLGTANLGAGLFQGFSIGASLSKSAANDAAGARSQLSGIFAAALTVVVALFLTPLFHNLPEATLAAIVIVAVSGMIKIGPIRRLYHVRKADFWLAMAAMLGVLTFEEVTTGLLFAVALSLLALIYRASQSKLAVLGRIPGRLMFVNQQRHPECSQIPGVLVVRPEEGLFFANASSLRTAIMKLIESSQEPVSMVLLDLAITNDLDVPGADMLIELDEALERRGIQLFLIRVHDPAQQILDRSGATDAIGPENFYPRIIDALLGHIGDIAAEEEAEQIVEDLSDVLEEIIAVEEDTDGTKNAKLNALRHKVMDIVQESHQ